MCINWLTALPFVEQISLFNIQRTKLRSTTKWYAVFIGRNSKRIIYRKTTIIIMHDATEIIWNSQWVDVTFIFLLKIVFTSRSNVLCMNGDIFISVWTTLLMPKANCMTNFMNYGSKWTLRANINRLEVAISSSNIRTAPVDGYSDTISVKILSFSSLSTTFLNQVLEMQQYIDILP